MRAPVYRHLDTKATFLGITFPVEWGLVLFAVVLGERTVGIFIGILAAIGLYVFLRLVSYGRPENHLQHWLLFRIRGSLYGGRFSSSARAPIPRCPFGPYLTRDVPRSRP